MGKGEKRAKCVGVRVITEDKWSEEKDERKEEGGEGCN